MCVSLLSAFDPNAGPPPVRALAGRYAKSIEIKLVLRDDFSGRIFSPLIKVTYGDMTSEDFAKDMSLPVNIFQI